MSQKIAVCVGQNEYHPHSGVGSLRGCVNDALLIGEMLRYAGFEIIRQIHNQSAIQQGILDRIKSEVARLRKGDYFVFWNSSHGYQIQDRNGDELVDGFDEAITTYDTDPRDPLTDDKFAQVLSRAHPEAFVFFASDSCHSGSLTREMIAKEHHNGRTVKVWIPPDDILFRTGKTILPLDKYFSDFKTSEGKKDLRVRQLGLLSKNPEDMDHLFLSGCESDKVSYDARFSEGYHGAMTYYFAKAVLGSWKDRKSITYDEAHRQAVSALESAHFNQIPQLEGPDGLKNQPVFGLEFI